MVPKDDFQNNVQDGVVASGLIAAPAWAPWLSNLNAILTTATLILGLVLGFTRLWSFYKRRHTVGK